MQCEISKKQQPSTTVEIIALNNSRAALRVCLNITTLALEVQGEDVIECTFVGRAICRIVAALDTRARAGGLDEFDVVLVPELLLLSRPYPLHQTKKHQKKKERKEGS
jgi:hypothetical protein